MQCGDNKKLAKICLLSFLCFISTFSVACQRKPKDVISILQPCQELVDKEEFVAVGKCYNDQLVANPQFADEIEETFSKSLFEKCIQLKEKENYEKAIVCFEGVSVFKPDSANVQFLLARSYYQYNKTKRYDDYEVLGRAENAIKKCLEIQPNDVEAYYVYGRILTQKGELREAIEKYREALRLEPKKDFLWFGLAMSQEESGNASSALASYYQVLTLDPKNTLALYNSAKLYEKTGNIDQAITNFEKLLEIRSDYDDARERLENLKKQKVQPKQKTKMQGVPNDGTHPLP